MSIYNGTYESLKKDLLELREMFIRTKTKSESALCIDSIYSLERLCNCLKKENSSYYEQIYKKNKNKIKECMNIKNRYLDAYMENFIENKTFLRNLLFKNIEIFDDMLEQNNEEIETIEPMFSEASADLLVHDFFKKYYPKHKCYIDKLILDKRLIKVDEIEHYDGMCFNIYRKEPIILVQNNKYTMRSIITLIHELAHAIDFKDMNEKFSVNKCEKYNYQSNYVEFLSRLYERQALDYFYDLNIDNDSVTSMYLDYDYGIYSDMVASYAFTLLPDEILKRSNYLKFSREELKLMIPCEYFTEQVEEALDDEFVDVNQSLRYAMSSLLALYCNGVLKENEDKGNYIFENIMANRADLFRKEMFEELAINGQEMSKILIKEMNYNQK